MFIHVIEMFRSEKKNVPVNKESENTTKRMLCKEYMRMIPDSRKQCSYYSRTARISVQIISKKVKSTFPYDKILLNTIHWCSCKGKYTKKWPWYRGFQESDHIIKSMQFKAWDRSNLRYDIDSKDLDQVFNKSSPFSIQEHSKEQKMENVIHL